MKYDACDDSKPEQPGGSEDLEEERNKVIRL